MTRRSAVASERQRRDPLTWIVAACVLLLPLLVIPGGQMFRFPKELLIRFEGLLLVTLLLCGALLRGVSAEWRAVARERWILVVAAIVVWTSVATLTSLDRAVSVMSLVHLVAAAAIFVVTVVVSRRRGIGFAALPFIPALINFVVMLLQLAQIWTPMPAGHFFEWLPSGLIGTTNDVGCTMMFVSLAAAALSLSSSRWRWSAAAVSVVIALATILSATLTAVVSLIAGLFVLAAMRSVKLALAAVVAVVVLAVGAFAAFQPVQDRFERLSDAVEARDYDRVFSFRFTGYLTAWMMTADHPVTGTGPGMYGPLYFDYRARAEERQPQLAGSGARMFNFAEAHNDHLQVAAETGIPGYLLFLVAIATVAMQSFRKKDGSERGELARMLAMPLAVAFALLAFAQFPLQVAAPLHTILFYAALCIGWRPAA